MNGEGGWPLRRLGLKVLDLEKTAAYYRRLGLTEIARDRSEAVYGFEGTEVLWLRALPGGSPRPPRSSGLFHFALLVPTEASLGAFLRHTLDTGIPLDGASDHLVSQALYLSDPEGNGIEVYADRAPESWDWSGREVKMATLPLDAQPLLDAAGDFPRFPGGSRLGHMHLTVGDLDRAQRFYGGLGMEVTANWGPFRFLAWNRYHHHLGANLASGRGAAPVTPDVAGLEWFEVARPGREAGRRTDPAGVEVRIASA